jgi:hypothetical protein
MMKWFKGRTDKDTKGSNMPYDPRQDDPLVPKIFLASMQFLDVLPDQQQSEVEFVSRVTTSLLSKVKSKSKYVSADSDVVDFVDGIFILCICNIVCHHFSLVLELPATKSLAERFAMTNSGVIPEVIEHYNYMLAQNDDVPKMIFSTVRNFFDQPSSSSLTLMTNLHAELVSGYSSGNS